MKRETHLVRQIGLGSGIAVVVGSTIGSGIFKSPSGIAGQLPGPGPMLAVWLFGGLIVLCGALTLAEVGGAFPYSGGQYVFLREAFGRLPAFLFGWSSLVLVIPSGFGAIAIVFAQHFLKLMGKAEADPGFDALSAAIAIAAIIGTSVANILGVRLGTLIQNLTTVAKTLGLLFLILLAFALALPQASNHFAPAVPTGSFSISTFGLALVSVLWAYDGWADGFCISGEVENPQKNVPKLILLGTASVIVVYILANLAYLAVFSVQEMAKSESIAADAMVKLVGRGGGAFIVATVMISTFGTLSAGVLTAPRIFFAMAEDGLFFTSLATTHPKYKTPATSIILTAGLGIIYVVIASAMSGSKAFGALTDAFVIATVPFYALSVGSVFVLRRREKRRRISVEPIGDSLIDPVEPGHLETHPHAYAPSVYTPLFPVTPIIFIFATLFLLANSLIDSDSRIPTIITLGVVVLGIPVFYSTIGRIRTGRSV